MVVSNVLARVRRDPFSDLPVAGVVNQLCVQSGHLWRDRLFTPLVTIRLFVTQVLHANTAINHLRQLAGMDFSAGSFCDARKRLPLALLQGLLRRMTEWADRGAGGGPPLLGGRTYVCDGSSATTFDTRPLRERFGLPAGQRPGIGYPMARIMGLLDAATGLFVELLALPLFTHDMRGVLGLHGCLRAGDVLLGDRAFCSFAHFCLLNTRGVFGCFRLHQRRKNTTRGSQKWKKPRKAPAWMPAAQFALLPPSVTVRVVRYTVAEKGFRTREVFVATTLLDQAAWPDDRVADLYGRRWPIETCFGHLKTTLGMDRLKCESVDGVLKELAVYLIAYNLIRLWMLRCAKLLDVPVDRVSFVDAARSLAAWVTGSRFIPRPRTNPRRPGRHNPRVVRRRPRQYQRMTKPRADYQQHHDEAQLAA